MNPLKVLFGMFVATALACFGTATASADFIQAPASRLAVPPLSAATAAAGGGASALWRQSAHLELGYYAPDGAETSLRSARSAESSWEAAPALAGLGLEAGLPRTLAVLAASLGLAAWWVTRRLRKTTREPLRPSLPPAAG